MNLIFKGISLLAILYASSSFAEYQECSNVTIDHILTGPKHKSMIKVSSESCGRGGYVCIDTTGETMTEQESNMLFSFILANHMAGKPVRIAVETSKTGCNYATPFIVDARTD